MKTKTKTKARRRRCSECGELKENVLGKQLLCEKCEEDKEYCTICDEWLDRAWGGGCRHVGWSSEHGLAAGCGSEHLRADDHKESFLLLLDRICSAEQGHYDGDEWLLRPAMPKILECIEANNFWTCWHGPLIGGPPDLTLRYEKDFGTHKSVLDICDIRSTEQLKWDNIDDLRLGMTWLTSLDSKSVNANKLTAEWIRGWMKGKPGAVTEKARLAKERKEVIAELMALVTNENSQAVIAALNAKTKKELDSVPMERVREVLASLKAQVPA